MSKKLYEVTVEFTYYALANSERDAESFADAAFQDEDHTAIAEATEITQADEYLCWPGDSLVYGIDRDTTLDQALASIGLPSVEEMKRIWYEKLKRKVEGVKP
jgi:hypothetical protein